MVLVPYYPAVFIVTRHNEEQPGYPQVIGNNIKYYNHYLKNLLCDNSVVANSLTFSCITLVKYDKFIAVVNAVIKPK